MKCIPGDYLMKLVERMPRVCKAVIRALEGCSGLRHYISVLEVSLQTLV